MAALQPVAVPTTDDRCLALLRFSGERHTITAAKPNRDCTIGGRRCLWERSRSLVLYEPVVDLRRDAVAWANVALRRYRAWCFSAKIAEDGTSTDKEVQQNG